MEATRTESPSIVSDERFETPTDMHPEILDKLELECATLKVSPHALTQEKKTEKNIKKNRKKRKNQNSRKNKKQKETKKRQKKQQKQQKTG